MGRFVFKLQSVLDLKVQVEDIKKNELGKAVQRLEAEKQVLSDYQAERENCVDGFAELSARGVQVVKLKEHNAYIQLLNTKIHAQKETVNLAEKDVDNYREKLVKAAQEREMLEKLKEKKRQEYKKEQLKEEQKINDEIISYNYNKVLTEGNNGDS